jgi:hypothetical protein
MPRTNSGLHKVLSQREQVCEMRFRATYFGDLCAGAMRDERPARRGPFVGDPRSDFDFYLPSRVLKNLD